MVCSTPEAHVHTHLQTRALLFTCLLPPPGQESFSLCWEADQDLCPNQNCYNDEDVLQLVFRMVWWCRFSTWSWVTNAVSPGKPADFCIVTQKRINTGCLGATVEASWQGPLVLWGIGEQAGSTGSLGNTASLGISGTSLGSIRTRAIGLVHQISWECLVLRDKKIDWWWRMVGGRSKQVTTGWFQTNCSFKSTIWGWIW